MKLIIDIPNNKADFGIEVLKSLSFVREIKSISNVDLWGNLQEAAQAR